MQSNQEESYTLSGNVTEREIENKLNKDGPLTSLKHASILHGATNINASDSEEEEEANFEWKDNNARESNENSFEFFNRQTHSAS